MKRKGCGKKIDALGYIICGEFDDLKHGGKQWLCDRCGNKLDKITNIEIKIPKDEEYLDKEFPKGKTKFRGQAMVLLALAREVGKEEAKKEFIELIDKMEKICWDCKSCCVVNSDVDKCKSCGENKNTSWDNEKLEDLKKQVLKEGEK